MRRMYSENQIKKLAENKAKVKIKYGGGYGDISLRVYYNSLTESNPKAMTLKDDGEEIYLENVSEIYFIPQAYGGAEIDMYGGCFAYHDSQTPVFAFPSVSGGVAPSPDENIGTNIVIFGDSYIFLN